MLDTEYRDENQSTYMVYQTKDELVIKVSFGKYNRPHEVNFSFGEGKVIIEGEGSFEKSMWKKTRKVRETRNYPVFNHTIPLNVAVDPEGAKATFSGVGWTLTIPRKR